MNLVSIPLPGYLHVLLMILHLVSGKPLVHMAIKRCQFKQALWTQRQKWKYLIVQYGESVGRQDSYKDFIPIAYDMMNNRATQNRQPDYSWPIDRIVHTLHFGKRLLYTDLIRSTK